MRRWLWYGAGVVSGTLAAFVYVLVTEWLDGQLDLRP